MATRVRLDRKARTAIWVLVGLALAVVALAARELVNSLTTQQLAAVESVSTSAQLPAIDSADRAELIVMPKN